MKAQELIDNLKSVLSMPTWYVMGGFGTRIGKDYIAWNYTYNAEHRDSIEAHITNPYTFGFDCVCLIKAVLFWGFSGDQNAEYGGSKYVKSQDITIDKFKKSCAILSTDFGENDLVPGELVFMPNHIGVYIGNGEVIECTPAWKGNVQKTLLPWRNSSNHEHLPVRAWEQHGQSSYIDYTVGTPIQPDTTDWKAKYEEAAKDLEKFGKTIDQLQTTLKTVEQERDNTKTALTICQAQLASKTTQLTDAQNQVSKLTSSLNTAQSKNESFRESLADAEAKIGDLTIEKNRLQKELEGIVQGNTSVQQATIDLIDNLTHRVDDLTAERDDLQTENARLSNALLKAKEEQGAVLVGDVNGDGKVDFGDVVSLIFSLFRKSKTKETEKNLDK